MENTPNLDFFQDMVKSLIIEDNHAVGVVTSLGIEIRSKAVVLTNGTFLNGLIHVGDKQLGGGRMPVGVHARTAPGQYTAQWSSRVTVDVQTWHGHVVDARSNARRVEILAPTP